LKKLPGGAAQRAAVNLVFRSAIAIRDCISVNPTFVDDGACDFGRSSAALGKFRSGAQRLPRRTISVRE
jgi:hypothetical protein